MDRRQEEGSSSQPPRWEGIKHKDVKIPPQTKARDFVKACFTSPEYKHEHRPERVNKEIDEFNETLQKIDGKLHAEYLPKELKDKLEETTRFLREDFERSSDQAVRGKGRQSRQEGEKRIQDLHEIIQNMSKDLAMWMYIDNFQARIKNVPPSGSNDAISNLEQLVADKVIDDLKDAHKQVLDCYRRPSDLPLTKIYLQNNLKRLEEYYKIFSTFSKFSDKWREIHEARAKLEATHSEDTEYGKQVKQLAINRASDTYKQGLAWFQEADYGWPLRAERFRDAIVKDAYEQLEIELNKYFKDYEIPKWSIKPKKIGTPKCGDFLKKIIYQSSTESRSTRVEEVVTDINAELAKMRKVLQTSDFPYSLKHTIRNEIDASVQHIEQSYEQAIKYDGYVGDKGRASREKSEAKLKNLVSDLQNKREAIGKLNEFEVTDLDNMKDKINQQYEHFADLIKYKILNTDNTAMKRKLSMHLMGMMDFRWRFSRSCQKGDFLEAGKWAKQLISETEALESYLIKHSFRTHFLSKIAEQALSQSEQTQLASINRHTPVSQVPEKWQKAFTIARGHAVLEKVNNLPNKDINTNKAFNHRYDNIIYKIEEDNISEFRAHTRIKQEEDNLYINYINIDNGTITACINWRDKDGRYDGKPLPNSEILYHQLLSVLKDRWIDPSNFNLTRVIRGTIINEETCNTLDCSITLPRNVQSTRNFTYQFARGSDEYYAILGTPNAYSTLFLLKQHPSIFAEREITSIEVEMSHSCNPNITLHIGQREQADRFESSGRKDAQASSNSNGRQAQQMPNAADAQQQRTR